MRAKPKAKLLVIELSSHFTMGLALGLAFALILVMVQSFGVSEMINASPAPRQALAIVAASLGTSFGIGAVLTALLFKTMDQER